MNKPGKDLRKRKKAAAGSAVFALLKCFITLWSLSGSSLSLMLSGYSMDVPIAKYFFTLLGALDGWGTEMLFMALGLGMIYYLVRDRQKSPWVSGISIFFAICTVTGISYAQTDSWDCIFLYKLQFALALFVMLGYYFAYKNCILFVAWLLERKSHWLRKEPANAMEIFLFRQHTFGGPFLLIMILALPWLLFYFPGTLQWDAHAQLWVFFGDSSAAASAGNHPVILTQIMGGCVWLGRRLFHSDSIGLFLYTGVQFLVQSLTFSYASYLLRKLNTPILFSWGALFYWAVHPFFPIWGYTMVKDTPFYIFILLNIVVLMDIIRSGKRHANWWQVSLFLFSAAGITLARNDGRYVILVMLLFVLLLYRSCWRVGVAGIAFCLMLSFAVDNIYMPYHNIARGNTADILSVPLQQTARYLREHYEEVTGEEAAVLQEGFTVELSEIPNLYYPVCSDPVKAHFQAHTGSEYLRSYFKVWFGQMLKHPDTYIQAFLNQIYAYFYPDQHDYRHDTIYQNTAVFVIGNSDKWHDDYLDIEFGISDNSGRRILQHFFYTVEKMPVFSMFFSTGVHTYLLLGECVYLLAKKRRREILFLIPGLTVLALRLFSPVACLRYVLPIMVMLPVTAAWCYFVTHGENVVRER